MPKVNGKCHCGNISVEVELTGPSESYSPRACDCDFCMSQNIAYISDAKGRVRYQIRDKKLLGKYRQGSETAEFLFCGNCSLGVGVVYQEGQNLFSALNVRILDRRFAFAEPIVVTPKLLSAPEKTKRWKEVWFSNVEVQ